MASEQSEQAPAMDSKPMPAIVSKSRLAICRLLKGQDDSDKWESCFEANPIKRGSQVEYHSLVDNLKDVCKDTDMWTSIVGASSTEKGLPKRFLKALHATEPTAVLDTPAAPESVDQIAAILERLTILEGLIRPVAKETSEVLQKSVELVKAANHRLDEIPSLKKEAATKSAASRLKQT